MHFDIKQAFSLKVKVTQVCALQVDPLPAEPQEKPKNTGVGSLSLLQWIFPTQGSNFLTTELSVRLSIEELTLSDCGVGEGS